VNDGVTWVDSHCHVQPGHGPDTLEGSDEVVQRAHAAGVAWMVCVGTDLETSLRAIDLAGRHPGVRATVGLHPHDASKLGAEWSMLEPLALDEQVVGIGEAGFDLYYEYSPRDEQETAFRFQVRLAKDLDRALVIHSRDAWDDTFRVLEDEGPPARTVFHCFTGGPTEAQRALDLGAHLSFSGIVTFRNALDLRAAAAIVPDDRLLVETDSPFLTPEPYRGKPNEPALVPVIGAALAAARGIDDTTVARLTSENAARVFGVSAPSAPH
jgi:TatD DNase family protein